MILLVIRLLGVPGARKAAQSAKKTLETPRFVRALQPDHLPKRHVSLVAKRSTIKPEPVRLTSEEKYAYNQLLLALSITSSKLKLVHEKIDRVEDRKEITKENNR